MGKYSCNAAEETLEWINAIIDFITPYSFFWEAHVVNFFKDRLWEAVDKEWIDCLCSESVETLLLIPSGVVQDKWPASLKEFILTLRSLALPRKQADLNKVTALNTVISQGMNKKKKHEIETLAVLVSSLAKSTEASTIIDVGSGQGYLAQVLSFECYLPVIAIDACSHHGRITDARAERIKKHYAAKMRKSCSEAGNFTMPKTVTCHVLSTEMLKSFTKLDDTEMPCSTRQSTVCEKSDIEVSSTSGGKCKSSLLLAGLHACGDLSVTMLRTFLECKDVKAVVSIGCCYNLLTEVAEGTDSQGCFPLSKGFKSAGFPLGRNARDLACQSADRWRGMRKDAGVHNFDLHTFRAAFQMVLAKYFPETLTASPAVGRQGKALRRQQQQGMLDSIPNHQEKADYCESISAKTPELGLTSTVINSSRTGSSFSTDTLLSGRTANNERSKLVDKFPLFEKFSQSALHRLKLNHNQDVDFAGLWKECEAFAELIGPYWSLRAALGPVLETLLLLDRLLFLQEQNSSMEVFMIPVFDPTISPRNIALIAKRA